MPNVKHNLSVGIPNPFESPTIILAVAALSLDLVKGPDWGWGNGEVIASWAVVAAAAGLFCLINRRAAEPVVDLAMFRSRVFASANAGIVLVSAAIAVQPGHVSATRSAVVQMGRQMGSVLGTSVLVAILGAAVISGAQQRFFDACWVTVGVCALGVFVALGLTPRRPVPDPATAASAAAPDPAPQPTWPALTRHGRTPSLGPCTHATASASEPALVTCAEAGEPVVAAADPHPGTAGVAVALGLPGYLQGMKRASRGRCGGPTRVGPPRRGRAAASTGGSGVLRNCS